MSSGTLYVYAATPEAGELASDARCVRIGVGKVAAAVELSAVLAERRPAAVVAFGVAGSYPAAELDIGELCLVTEDGLGDEGVQTPDGFLDVAALGLDDAPRLWADEPLTERVAAVLGPLPRVRGATVSTGSGTDARAEDLAARTGAAVETMEGAAIAWACRRAGVPWAQVRAISNRTGDRDRGEWDLAGATSAVQAAVRRLLDAGV